MQERRKKVNSSCFTLGVCHLLPSHWQSCAIVLAKLCHRIGKSMPVRWQNIGNIITIITSLRDHCSVRLTIKIYSSFPSHSMHTSHKKLVSLLRISFIGKEIYFAIWRYHFIIRNF
ncbi:hypothetical protein DW715_00605 [Bacteroides intestinalis]|nr:hypothetical protein DW715_00605 [Bacteroides intestinalis]